MLGKSRGVIHNLSAKLKKDEKLSSLRLGASYTLSLPEKASRKPLVSHATGAAVEKVTSEGLGKTHPMV